VQIVADLADRFNRATGAIVAEFRGLSVEEMRGFRGALRKADLDFKVVKNTLARRAVAGTPVEPIRDGLSGQVGVALGYDDPVVLAKSVLEFAKANDEKFRVRLGVIEGKPCDAAMLASVAKLPGRDVLLGQVAGMFQAPGQKLAGLLANTVNRFAFALHALKEKKEAA